MEKKYRKGRTTAIQRSKSGNGSSSTAVSGRDLFIVSVNMIAEKLCLAKQSEGHGAQEMNRYITVYFDYSSENDIPTMLSLASR